MEDSSNRGWISRGVCAGSRSGGETGASAVRAASPAKSDSSGGGRLSPILPWSSVLKCPPASLCHYSPASASRFPALENADDVKGLLLRQRVDSDGPRRPGADNGDRSDGPHAACMQYRGSGGRLSPRESWVAFGVAGSYDDLDRRGHRSNNPRSGDSPPH